jgi:hypothetical protein
MFLFERMPEPVIPGIRPAHGDEADSDRLSPLLLAHQLGEPLKQIV